LPTELSPGPDAPVGEIPLARWADRRLAELAALCGSPALTALDGQTLLGERAAINGFRIPGLTSAGGGCRLLRARDGWFALNLARDADRELLPALFGTDALDPADDAAIAAHVAGAETGWLLERGRTLGLAVASTAETPTPAAIQTLTTGPSASPPVAAPLVLDLSALWAGPLAGHLLHLAGARVIKVESAARPDHMRQGDPSLFAQLNQGKDNVALDLRQDSGSRALLALIDRADIVIEAARPRALRQMGIDANQLVRQKQGRIWLTITGHGASGEAADWTGFGDDCGIAGGLGAELARLTGRPGFVGDAIADPLTGIVAALAGWRAWQSGQSSRIGIAMRGVVAAALADEGGHHLDGSLRQWAGSIGALFPLCTHRVPTGRVAALGADNARWLPC
jgi:hypothetical protein